MVDFKELKFFYTLCKSQLTWNLDKKIDNNESRKEFFFKKPTLRLQQLRNSRVQAHAIIAETREERVVLRLRKAR